MNTQGYSMAPAVQGWHWLAGILTEYTPGCPMPQLPRVPAWLKALAVNGYIMLW